MPLRPLLRFAAAAALFVSSRGAEPPAPARDHPALRGVTPVEDPAEAARRLTVAPGLRAELWAAEPQIENPVSFTFDASGRCFVAETTRRRSSALDIRWHRTWLNDSLAMRSVEDRLAFLQRAFIDQKKAPFLGLIDRDGDRRLDWRDLAVESERIRLLEDRDGDGRAETSAIVAQDFNTAVTGIGAGLLAHRGELYFTCLPDLWRLRPAAGADRGEALLTGFGVHITYSGHDLHGLALGPDGKLYWTVGDCGARVATKEGRVLDVADTGAVFRANIDGSECEIVMRGLRNPVELCFNDVGDLFTADNNADGGDLARWVHVVEGGDAGWHIGWQAMPRLGAWNAEQLWKPEVAQTALSLLPPVGTIGHGPSGIACDPGTGLPAAWREHFFLCDFPGGVRSFKLKSRAASYAIDAPPRALHDNTHTLENKLVWGFYPTDVEFAPGGGVFVLDWVRDVEKPGKGRIFRLHDPATDANPLVRETRELLAADLTARAAEELARLLGHADRRVRMAAQFGLVEKREIDVLSAVVRSDAARLARLHAIWGLGQLGRQSPALLAPCREMLRDADSEVRTQAARVLGESRASDAASVLITALADSEPRVRSSAALALGRIGASAAVPALFEMLRADGGTDALLRHSAVMGLAACADTAGLTARADDSSESVRAGALLALRRQKRLEVVRFLGDASPQLVLEAARAIYDEPIDAAMPGLCALTTRANLAFPIAIRAIHANFRLGDAPSAARLAVLAADVAAPEPLRVAAIEALGDWNTAAGLDRFLGLCRALPVTRDSRAASLALAPVLPALLAPYATMPVRQAAIASTARLGLREVDRALVAIVSEEDAAPALRTAALQALAKIESPQTAIVLKSALTDRDATLRAKALEIETKLDPDQAAEAASNVLKIGTVAERQNALRTLGELRGKIAGKHLGKWLDRFAAGEVPAALHLDLFEAAAQQKNPAIQQKLASISEARAPGRLGPWRECLEGGDAGRGRDVFSSKVEAGCLRCHKVRGVGGDVGPDLSGIGLRRSRVAILKAILFPNDDFPPGYQFVALKLKDGRELSGVVISEDAVRVTLRLPGDGQSVEIGAADILQRIRAPSAMPEGLGTVLGKRDLRDLVEFLATQK